ncbi:hypothetical protein ADUPG1_011677, partial [Aduncisulcus paluster]
MPSIIDKSEFPDSFPKSLNDYYKQVGTIKNIEEYTIFAQSFNIYYENWYPELPSEWMPHFVNSPTSVKITDPAFRKYPLIIQITPAASPIAFLRTLPLHWNYAASELQKISVKITKHSTLGFFDNAGFPMYLLALVSSSAIALRPSSSVFSNSRISLRKKPTKPCSSAPSVVKHIPSTLSNPISKALYVYPMPQPPLSFGHGMLTTLNSAAAADLRAELENCGLKYPTDSHGRPLSPQALYRSGGGGGGGLTQVGMGFRHGDRSTGRLVSSSLQLYQASLSSSPLTGSPDRSLSPSVSDSGRKDIGGPSSSQSQQSQSLFSSIFTPFYLSSSSQQELLQCAHQYTQSVQTSLSRPTYIYASSGSILRTALYPQGFRDRTGMHSSTSSSSSSSSSSSFLVLSAAFSMTVLTSEVILSLSLPSPIPFIHLFILSVSLYSTHNTLQEKTKKELFSVCHLMSQAKRFGGVCTDLSMPISSSSSHVPSLKSILKSFNIGNCSPRLSGIRECVRLLCMCVSGTEATVTLDCDGIIMSDSPTPCVGPFIQHSSHASTLSASSSSSVLGSIPTKGTGSIPTKGMKSIDGHGGSCSSSGSSGVGLGEYVHPVFPFPPASILSLSTMTFISTLVSSVDVWQAFLSVGLCECMGQAVREGRESERKRWESLWQREKRQRQREKQRDKLSDEVIGREILSSRKPSSSDDHSLSRLSKPIGHDEEEDGDDSAHSFLEEVPEEILGEEEEGEEESSSSDEYFVDASTLSASSSSSVLGSIPTKGTGSIPTKGMKSIDGHGGSCSSSGSSGVGLGEYVHPVFPFPPASILSLSTMTFISTLVSSVDVWQAFLSVGLCECMGQAVREGRESERKRWESLWQREKRQRQREKQRDKLSDEVIGREILSSRKPSSSDDHSLSRLSKPIGHDEEEDGDDSAHSFLEEVPEEILGEEEEGEEESSSSDGSSSSSVSFCPFCPKSTLLALSPVQYIMRHTTVGASSSASASSSSSPSLRSQRAQRMSDTEQVKGSLRHSLGVSRFTASSMSDHQGSSKPKQTIGTTRIRQYNSGNCGSVMKSLSGQGCKPRSCTKEESRFIPPPLASLIPSEHSNPPNLFTSINLATLSTIPSVYSMKYSRDLYDDEMASSSHSHLPPHNMSSSSSSSSVGSIGSDMSINDASSLYALFNDSRIYQSSSSGSFSSSLGLPSVSDGILLLASTLTMCVHVTNNALHIDLLPHEKKNVKESVVDVTVRERRRREAEKQRKEEENKRRIEEEVKIIGELHKSDAQADLKSTRQQHNQDHLLVGDDSEGKKDQLMSDTAKDVISKSLKDHHGDSDVKYDTNATAGDDSGTSMMTTVPSPTAEMEDEVAKLIHCEEEDDEQEEDSTNNNNDTQSGPDQSLYAQFSSMKSLSAAALVPDMKQPVMSLLPSSLSLFPVPCSHHHIVHTLISVLIDEEALSLSLFPSQSIPRSLETLFSLFLSHVCMSFVSLYAESCDVAEDVCSDVCVNERVCGVCVDESLDGEGEEEMEVLTFGANTPSLISSKYNDSNGKKSGGIQLQLNQTTLSLPPLSILCPILDLSLQCVRKTEVRKNQKLEKEACQSPQRFSSNGANKQSMTLSDSLTTSSSPSSSSSSEDEERMLTMISAAQGPLSPSSTASSHTRGKDRRRHNLSSSSIHSNPNSNGGTGSNRVGFVTATSVVQSRNSIQRDKSWIYHTVDHYESIFSAILKQGGSIKSLISPDFFSPVLSYVLHSIPVFAPSPEYMLMIVSSLSLSLSTSVSVSITTLSQSYTLMNLLSAIKLWVIRREVERKKEKGERVRRKKERHEKRMKRVERRRRRSSLVASSVSVPLNGSSDTKGTNNATGNTHWKKTITQHHHEPSQHQEQCLPDDADVNEDTDSTFTPLPALTRPQTCTLMVQSLLTLTLNLLPSPSHFLPLLYCPSSTSSLLFLSVCSCEESTVFIGLLRSLCVCAISEREKEARHKRKRDLKHSSPATNSQLSSSSSSSSSLVRKAHKSSDSPIVQSVRSLSECVDSLFISLVQVISNNIEHRPTISVCLFRLLTSLLTCLPPQLSHTMRHVLIHTHSITVLLSSIVK